MMSHRSALTILTALSLAACGEPAPPDPQFVAQWVRASLVFVADERLAPPVASRVTAYASLALYEGYAADERSRLRSLAGQLNGLWSVPNASRTAGGPVDGATVAAEAERVVLDSLFSGGSARTTQTIDSLALAQITRRRSSGVGTDMSERSVLHGRALGRSLLAWSATDGFLASRGRPWNPTRSVAQWANPNTREQVGAKPRAGGFGVMLAGTGAAPRPATTLSRLDPTQPTEPHWGTLRTFALRNGDECAPPRPPVYSEQRGSDFWKMARELYDSVSSLSPEKRAIAVYWADDSVVIRSPGFHWIGAVSQMIPRRSLTADQAVEAYAMTSVAIADAFIGSWKQKYRSMGVRPVTYVQRVINPTWQPAITTPPFPEYPSSHSAISAAATEVLTRMVGDSIPFADSTQMEGGASARSFRNFTHARDEAALSSVYGGVHFVPAVVNGLEQGQCVGQRVLGRLRTRS